MKQYHEMLRHILDNGELISNGRTKEGYISTFGYQNRYNLREGFPMVTTKKVSFRLIATELLWFLSGSSNVKDLQAQNNHIWDEWATKEQCAKFGREEGNLGPIYGPLWRKWKAIHSTWVKKEISEHITDPELILQFLDELEIPHRICSVGEAQDFDIEKAYELKSNGSITKDSKLLDTSPYDQNSLAKLGRLSEQYVQVQKMSLIEIDQIARVIERIKTNPSCRRLIVSGWNPATADKVSLPPCHTLFQMKVSHGGTRLNCQLYQRSADAFLGVPFNIASYALLTHMIAQVTGLEVGEFVHTFGDLHIYEPHLSVVREQLTREPLPLPKLWLNSTIKSIDDFKIDDIKLEGYTSHSALKADVAV